MPTQPLDFRNLNTLWASVLVETLARVGVTQAVISPGSRSTPLTVALARHPEIEAVPVLDERSASFFALGLARKSGRTVVLVCTSGTAGANYFPAVIEAQESGVPLLVITADRPPELRDCASGQTIDQQRLFGAHVGFYHELALPEASIERLAYLRQTIAHATTRTQQPQRGPVHLNAPFRDPLPPVATTAAAFLEGRIPAGFFAHLAPASAGGPGTVEIWPEGAAARGLIVAGPEIPDDPAHYAQIVGGIAAALSWPILADGVSALRHFGAGSAAVIANYDTILRHERVAAGLQPDQILCLGGWPTSKVLRQWVQAGAAEVTLVSRRHDNRDGLHGRTRHLAADVAGLRLAPAGPFDPGYAAAWVEAERKVAPMLTTPVAVTAPVFEGDVVAVLDAALPDEASVFVASSMPIRDVEYFWPVNTRRRRFYFNRGANGIDGTLSSALGVAHGGNPTVLLTGDLALLHDSNGFLLRDKLRGSLTVVLINNHGGGIFEHLPIAEFDPPFEDFFATPQAVDFASLCQAHGVDHVAVRDRAHLAALVAASPSRGIRVLEVSTDRKRDVKTRKARLAAAARALE